MTLHLGVKARILHSMKRAGVVCILALAFCGMAVSAYIAQQEISGAPLICDISSLSGCNVVVDSPYSHVFGISLAQLGLLFYTILFVVAAFELVFFNQALRRILQMFAVFGIISSIYSVITQAFFIRAYCIYCLASVLITILVLVCASMIEPIWKKRVSSATTP